jgi:uncharacterized protein YigA (DUF484 family)
VVAVSLSEYQMSRLKAATHKMKHSIVLYKNPDKIYRGFL